MRIIWIKEVVGCTCDTVYLGKSTDTEKANADTKESKKLCKPFPFFSHTFFDIVERTAHNMSVFCNCTIFYSKKTFRIFGGCSQKGCDPHPE